ncbi:NAD(P)-binding protein [bacterium]|nr:NAD(P)-binding protein [bacterium]
MSQNRCAVRLPYRQTAKGRQHVKINIIGGGLAGLTAAVYGARAGHEVTLFEKSRSLGGRARTRTDAGYCLNMGPHALYRSGAAAAILQELGVTFTGGPPKQRGYLGLNGKRVSMPRPFGLGFFVLRHCLILRDCSWR